MTRITRTRFLQQLLQRLIAGTPKRPEQMMKTHFSINAFCVIQPEIRLHFS